MGQYSEATAKLIIQHSDFLEKQARRLVPQTDTGGWDEDSKVLERFMAKELGKIGP